MEGFFSIKPNNDVARGMTCASCGLYKGALNPRMLPFGKFRRRILNIGEAPGETEDRRGRQWQGKMGQVLQYAYRSFGIDLFEDCLNINSINCRPIDSDGNNRPPTDKEIASCRQRVMNVIKESRPNLIVLLGQSAITSVLSTRWTKDLGSISRWRGFTIPDREFGSWVFPTFHPSYVERGQREIETIWMQDLRKAFEYIDRPPPVFADEREQVEIVDDISFLSDMTGPVAFDYETTGLKPHDTSKHRVVCMSVCNDPNKSYSFMITNDRDQRREIRMFLKDSIPKIAQNMKYEDTWSRNFFNCEVANWLWDPMLAAHVIDNRPDITGLKFQAYVNFGLADYDSEVAPFLKARDAKNANAINRIDELIKNESGRRKLLTYCGIDSLMEYRLAMKQMEELNVRTT